MDDNQWEPDEEFFLKLSHLQPQEEGGALKLGRTSIMEITILNDDGRASRVFSMSCPQQTSLYDILYNSAGGILYIR